MLRRSTDQTGNANNTYVPIAWDTVVFEDPVIWDPLTPTIWVAPKTGLYLVVYQAELPGGVGVWFPTIQVNNVDVSNQRDPAGTPSMVNQTALLELTAGDAVRACVYRVHTSGTYTIDATLTYLAITRIGPERWTG